MGFLDRLSTLARADAHGVVDALEDRALVLRQHLRDAAGELDRKRALLVAMEQEERDLGDELAGLREESRALDEDVGLALAGGKEELARFAARKLLPLRHGCRRIEERLSTLARDGAELRSTLATQETAYAELERRVRAHLARLEAEGEGRPWRWVEPLVTDEDVELELLRRRRGASPPEAVSPPADREETGSSASAEEGGAP